MGGPVRVLHIVVNMNRGGAETLIINLYRNVDRSIVQFDFLTCKEGVFDEEISLMGGKIYRIPYVTDVGHFGYMKALNQFFSSHPEYSIVHSHMDKMSGLVLQSAKKNGIPIRIAHSHGTSSEGGMAAKAYKWFAGKYILKSATHYLACSNKAAKWLFNDEGAAMILKNGIDCDKFVYSSEVRNRVRHELNLTPEHYVVGHVGRFAYLKNHAFLIDTFAQLHRDRPNAVLVLAGDGPLRREMEKKVDELKLSAHVKFLRVRSDIERLLQALDIFVFPSLHEGLPVTLIEAQRSGLTCIISDAITHEVDMGMGLVHFLPLSDSRVWVDTINTVAAKHPARDYPSDALTKLGYDIKQSAEWTENFYLAVSAR